MDDDITLRLARLAPTVDSGAARRAFAHDRARRRRRARATGALGATVTLAALVGGGMWWAAGDTGEQLSTAVVATRSSSPPHDPLVVGEYTTETMPAALIAGTVMFDGACITLDRALVPVWPAGTAWDGATKEIVLADGRRVGVSATISGLGGYYDVAAMAAIEPAVADDLERCVPSAPTGNDYVVLLDVTEVGPTRQEREGTADGMVGPVVIGGHGVATHAAALEASAAVAGEIRFDADCITLDGSVLPVWPAGTGWDWATQEVVLADGARIPLGATIEATGTYADEGTAIATDPVLADVLDRCPLSEQTTDAVVWIIPTRSTPPND